MSATNWDTCPNCEKLAAQAYAKRLKKWENSYGKVAMDKLNGKFFTVLEKDFNMLILSRHRDECVDINGGSSVPGGITVCIVDIRGDKVRLGFHAHEDIPIHRREVQKAIDDIECGRKESEGHDQNAAVLATETESE